MIETVLTKVFDAPPFNRNEILRYAGSGRDHPEHIVDECIRELEPHLTYSVCYREFPVEKRPDGSVSLSFTDAGSSAVSRLLEHSSRIVLFAATVGLHPDILIRRNMHVSPARSLFFSAIGSERVEALCDTFTAFFRSEYGVELTPRFSPGYSDLPLAVQKDIFRYLKPEQKIGINLNDSLLMSPSKSVTALAGIIDQNTD